MVRPRGRRQFNVLNLERIELGGSLTPVVGPLMLYPCEVPSGTKEAGEIWYDDDNNTIAFYNGTAIREVAANPAGQSSIPNYRPILRAATTLTSEHNGALCVFAAAAGYTYTLPTPQLGLHFDFVVEVTVTSVAAKVVTANTGTQFLLGTFVQFSDSPTIAVTCAANGTNIAAISMNGTTTGGYVGDWYRVHAISTTQWEIYGMGRATGTEATPFAAS